MSGSEIEAAEKASRKVRAAIGTAYGRDDTALRAEALAALATLSSTIQRLERENERLQRFIDKQVPGQCADCPGGTSWEDEAAESRQQAERETERANANAATVWELTQQAERLKAALEEIAALDGGYPDDYCSIARNALAEQGTWESR